MKQYLKFRTTNPSFRFVIVLMLIVLSSQLVYSPVLHSAPNPDSDFLFNESDGEVSITGYVGSSKTVVIPDRLGGFPVVTIGNEAFFNKALTSVTIPDSVKSIGTLAFSFNALTSVTIPDSVKSIGGSAFSYNALTSVTIPDSVESIGEQAFAFNALTSVTIPDSVKSIGGSAFSHNALTSVTIPDSVKSIGEEAFYGNALTSVTFLGENNTISISESTFDNITNNYGNTPLFTSFDVTPIKDYANHNSYPHYIVSLSANGDVEQKAAHKTTVSYETNQAAKALEKNNVTIIPDYYYQWSTTQDEPVWDSATWTTVLDGTEITTPATTGNWYLHIKLMDDITQIGYIRSNVFKVSITTPVSTTPTSTTTVPELIRSSTGSIYIPYGSSGEVSLDDKVRIELPRNTTQQSWNISITVIQSAALPQQTSSLSDVYSITSNLTSNSNQPMTVTLTFDATLLTSHQRAGLFYYDETTKTWLELQDSEVKENEISAEVTDLSTYTVLAVDRPNNLLTFTDISDHWATDAIYRASQLGFVTGYPDKTFQPQKAITRAEFAVMLMKALNQESDALSITFNDANQIGEWAKQAIAQALEAGYIVGYPSAEFKPRGEITRAEMAMIIFRVLAPQVVRSNLLTFSDADAIPNWVKQEVSLLNELGILQGKENNTFAPAQSTTRADAITVILKMLEQRGKQYTP